MTPRNGTNFGEDCATYLVNSGFSPNETVNGRNHQTESMSASQLESSAITRGSDRIYVGAKTIPFMSQGTFSRMPGIVTETPRKLPIPSLDLATYDLIVASIEKDILTDQREDEGIPSHQDFQRFLVSYFTCFHLHCPMLHISSLDPSNTPHHLILAICSVGALYRLCRKKARDLWSWANFLAEKVGVPANIIVPNFSHRTGTVLEFTGFDLTSRHSIGTKQSFAWGVCHIEWRYDERCSCKSWVLVPSMSNILSFDELEVDASLGVSYPAICIGIDAS